jgi:hypothetical protein
MMSPMSPTSQKTFTFVLPDQLKEGLRQVRKRDGVSDAEEIRRGIRMWLEAKSVIKWERMRVTARRRS